jgi:Ca2+-transporting ATPase
MITGDHAVTAAAIGKELGITGRAITGAEFAALSEEEALAQLPEIGVIARVSPEDKIRLVTLLQKMKNIVAMTGDGVNDAPALKKADIGVAMGITGTEVSKDSAVMILTDDNFATIVKAVEFGRGIYDNLMKYIRFQMDALVAFIGTFLGAAIFQVANGVPFGPVLLLWINFFVQVPIALGLGYDEPLGNLMERKPRPLNQPVISRNQWIRISIMGGLIAFVVLYFENMYWAESPAMAITFAATLFSVLNISIGLTVRDEFQTIFNREYWSKLNVIKLFGLSLLITILATELGFLQRILGTQSLSQDQWTIIFWIGILYVVVDEIVKLGLRKVKKIN